MVSGERGGEGREEIIEDSLGLDQCWLSRDIFDLWGLGRIWVIDAESGTGLRV